MRFIEDLRKRHEGEEIWILGCGPSLDDFPDDFFAGKISIAINFAIVAFPDCTYWHCSHPELPMMMKKSRPEIFKKSIFVFPFVPTLKHKPVSPEESLRLLGRYKNDPIFIRWNRVMGNRKRFLSYYAETVSRIMTGQPCNFTCLSSIVHYAIEIAAVLGAKKITLAGCEAAVRRNKWHAENRGIREFCERLLGPHFLISGKQIRKLAKFRQGTQLLAKAFKPYGIRIMNYFYNSGYMQIIN